MDKKDIHLIDQNPLHLLKINSAVSCWDDRAPVKGEWNIRTEQWWKILTGENQSTWIKELSHYTLSPTNPTCTSLGLTWASARRSQQPLQFLLTTNLNEVNVLQITDTKSNLTNGMMFHIKMDKDMYTSILRYSSLNFNLSSTLITFLTCGMFKILFTNKCTLY